MVIYRTFGDGYKTFIGQQDAHEFLQKTLDFMNSGFIYMGLIFTSNDNDFNILAKCLTREMSFIYIEQCFP